jgi:ribosome maturation factor RimP
LATAPSESGVENIYTLVLDFMQTQITLSQEQNEGEKVTFDVSMLNENYQYTGKIYDADGNNVAIEKDGVEYDCIKFKTVMNVTNY